MAAVAVFGFVVYNAQAAVPTPPKVGPVCHGWVGTPSINQKTRMVTVYYGVEQCYYKGKPATRADFNLALYRNNKLFNSIGDQNVKMPLRGRVVFTCKKDGTPAQFFGFLKFRVYFRYNTKYEVAWEYDSGKPFYKNTFRCA